MTCSVASHEYDIQRDGACSCSADPKSPEGTHVQDANASQYRPHVEYSGSGVATTGTPCVMHGYSLRRER